MLCRSMEKWFNNKKENNMLLMEILSTKYIGLKVNLFKNKEYIIKYSFLFILKIIFQI